jgi:prophage DNA circulation protein
MSDLIPLGIGPVVQSAGSALAVDNSGMGWTDATWWLQLQPGSWRGVGFVMEAAEIKAGRRVAVHEYAYRDTVWPEDLGLLPRRFSFQAYLTGDDVYQQRDAMLAACEQPGPGTLVHPTMGTIQVVLLDAGITDRRERGRYVEISFAFVLAGDVRYPDTATATGENVNASAAALNTASAGDLATSLAAMPLLPALGGSNVGQFAELAIAGVNDAARVFNAVNGLAGYYGRFASGSLGTLQPSTATVASLLAAATMQTTAVLEAASSLTLVVAGL